MFEKWEWKKEKIERNKLRQNIYIIHIYLCWESACVCVCLCFLFLVRYVIILKSTLLLYNKKKNKFKRKENKKFNSYFCNYIINKSYLVSKKEYKVIYYFNFELKKILISLLSLFHYYYNMILIWFVKRLTSSHHHHHI